MSKSCDSHPFSQNCICHDVKNADLKYFKQFNHKTQKFHCCYDVDVSPSELKNYRIKQSKTGIINGLKEYLSEINEYKNANNNTGCDYTEYKNLEINSNYNHSQLYNNLIVDNMIYNNFFVDNDPPSFGEYSITCNKVSEIPYILDYKGINNNNIIDKTLYVCNETKNTLFPSLRLNGELLDYKISYFYTNNNNPIFKNEQHNLKYISASNVGTRSNNSSIYENINKSLNSGYLIGGIVLIIVSFIFLWFIYEDEKNVLTSLAKK